MLKRKVQSYSLSLSVTTASCHGEHELSAKCRCNGVSSILKEQLRGQYNISQQAAIAAAVSPGQATFSLLQVYPTTQPFDAASAG